jgi:hypothetical protein
MIAATLAAMTLAGCPKTPGLAVSTASLHFGVVEGTTPGTHVYETSKTFDVWNNGASGTTTVFSVSADKPWITVTPAQSQSTGSGDKIAITVTIDRSYSNLEKAAYDSGLITIQAGIDAASVAVTTAPDYFTEAFGNGNNLDDVKLEFDPNGGPNFYGLTTAAVASFPTDPAGGAVLDFAAYGDPVKAGLFGDAKVPFYGQNYDTLYVSSKGSIGFGQAGTDSATLGEHFATKQLSVFPLNAKAAGSMVSYLQESDRLVITYENTPTPGGSGFNNNIQVELFFDGRINISYVDADPAAIGIVGLSSGAGLLGLPPADFLETTLNTGVVKAAK